MNKISNNFQVAKLNNRPVQKVSDTVPAAKSQSCRMTELPLNSFNKYLVNFTGLNRTLSKTAYQNAEAIKAELANFPKSNGVVGNLPSEWVQKIPKESREATIKGLYQDLKTIIKEFRDKDFNDDKIAQNLKEAFSKAGIIKESDEIKLCHLGEGQYGTGYRIKGVFDDKYMIKTFESNKLLSRYHGNYTELNRAAFWQKNAGANTQMVPFYFGDADAGYMVNKFIDKKGQMCKKTVNPEIYGLKSSDIAEEATGDNKINGFQIDYGGISVEDSTLLRDKQKQNFIKKLMAMPEKEQMKHLDRADSSAKNVFIDKIDALAEKERTAYFGALAKNSDDKIKAKLIDKICLLPEKEKAKCFDLLAENAGEKVKVKLAFRLDLVPEKQRTEIFEKLTKNAGEKLKSALADGINYLPEKHRAKFVKLLVKNSSEEIKEGLSRSIGWLPKGENTKCFKLLLENTGEETKIKLSYKIYNLEEKERIECFKILAENAGAELKKELAGKLRLMPEKQREKLAKLIEM